MNPNVQESEAAGRKRSHDEFTGCAANADDGDAKAPATLDSAARPGESPARPALLGDAVAGGPAPPIVPTDAVHASPSMPPALTDAASSTPADAASSTPKTHTAAPGTTADRPLVKRKRATAEEKAVREREAAQRKKEKEEQAALRAAEKAKHEEEKAARAKEREEKRRRKEDEDRAKAEKKRKKEEEKERKDQKQMRLSSFLGPRAADKPREAKSATPETTAAAEASKPAQTAYERMFQPFYVRDDTLWTKAPVAMDDETREAKSRSLDEHIFRQGQHDAAGGFDAAEMLCLEAKLPRRGRLHDPVKHIMEQAAREAERTGGGPANDALQKARRRLAKVPMRVIAFSHDVRPPYHGTVTLKPFAVGADAMYRQARKTNARRLPLDYDYDSEAEWQDDEGEDVDTDGDDEEPDDDDDMDGFLDDSEDAGLARRVFAKTMEPESTGVCFEDARGPASNRAGYEYRMDLMLGRLPRRTRGRPSRLTADAESLARKWGINPWTNEYWEQPERRGRPAGSGGQAGGKAAADRMAPPAAPASGGGGGPGGGPGLKLVSGELLLEVKRALLEHATLPKGGTVDIISQRLRGSASRAEVKQTIELVAEKTGTGKQRRWTLRPGHEMEP